MDDEQMTPDEEEIHRQMLRARAGLDQKLAALEHQVGETIHKATEKIKAIKESLNLPEQVNQHPWAFVGGAAGVGFAVGWLFRQRPVAVVQVPVPAAGEEGEMAHAGNGRKTAVAVEASRSWWAPVKEKIDPEIQKLKALAVGVVLDRVEDVLVAPVPEEMRPQVQTILDNIKEKLITQASSADAAREAFTGPRMRAGTLE
jgi:ElaB/YqjD/DUF883 family membrane-anchored ribosome-binding protein